MRLNVENCKKLMKTPGEYWDDELRGLHLKVTQNLHASLRIRYTDGGRRRSRSLTHFSGRAEEVQAARRMAQQTLASAAPVGEGRGVRAVQHPEEVIDAWNESGSDLSPGYRRRRLRDMRAHVLPLMQEVGLHNITVSDIQGVLNEVNLTKGGVAANRCRAHASAFFRYAVKNKYIDANPVLDTEKPYKESPRDRLLTLEEVRAIWRCSYQMSKSTGAMKPSSVAASVLRLLVATGQRQRNVVSGAYDITAPEKFRGTICPLLWTIPRPESKNGQVIDVFVNRKVAVDFKVIQKNRGFNSFGYLKRRVDSLVQVKDWHLHDLRAAMASFMLEEGAQEHIVDMMLGHSPRSVTLKVYTRARFYEDLNRAFGLWYRAITD